ncbi:hypothetical protein [Sphingobium amiense]|uniref:hypothetical protein n=1 Tax=Sphingobium amiense TaxID=135719 RepID=UPI0008338614|nr:hypothetical protein [Sphingobium amiense]
MIGLAYSAAGTAYTRRCIALGVMPGTLPGGPSGIIPDNSEATRYGGVGPVNPIIPNAPTVGGGSTGTAALHLKSTSHQNGSAQSFSDLIAKLA